MRLRTGDQLAVIDLGPGGALVESHRRLLPGTTVVIQLVEGGRTVTLDARVVRCAVCALDAGGGVRYRGALEFTGNAGSHRPASRT